MSQDDRSAGALGALSERHVDRQEYRRIVASIRAVVAERLPLEASVLTISRGDTTLVQFDGRRAGHFPQNEHGMYAGHHLADSTIAITHLEALRGKGAEYLIVPATAFWWFRHYGQFRRHLERHYPVLYADGDTCVIFALAAAEQPTTQDAASGYQPLVGEIRDLVDALLPDDCRVAVVSNGDDALLQLGARAACHLPQNEQGQYAGFHPADDAAAIAHVEALRSRGVAYVVVPQTSGWWLSHYAEFARHLATTGRLVTHQPHVCTIYALA